LLSAVIFTAPGCATLKRAAINQAGNALAGGGTTFASDNDPELIREAVPFSLKLMESLLAESPRHPGLLLGLSSGFTQYAYAFVQQDSDRLAESDLAAAEASRARAKLLYRRARDYGLRGLEVAHPGFGSALAAGRPDAAAMLRRSDVPQLYWTAASWGAAISLGKDDPALLVEIPQMEILIDRALQLDEAWNRGAIHSFLIGYEMSRPGDTAHAPVRAHAHFQRAVELSGGGEAAPFVTLAESVSVETQDAREFDAMLARALAVNLDAAPDSRLANLIMQRRARWLLERRDDLFLHAPAPTTP
jgi:predicted anti-sigma-YlaC factor YlaD